MMGSVCLQCSRSDELCFRLLFSNEPVFKKCKYPRPDAHCLRDTSE